MENMGDVLFHSTTVEINGEETNLKETLYEKNRMVLKDSNALIPVISITQNDCVTDAFSNRNNSSLWGNNEKKKLFFSEITIYFVSKFRKNCSKNVSFVCFNSDRKTMRKQTRSNIIIERIERHPLCVSIQEVKSLLKAKLRYKGTYCTVADISLFVSIKKQKQWRYKLQLHRRNIKLKIKVLIDKKVVKRTETETFEYEKPAENWEYDEDWVLITHE